MKTILKVKNIVSNKGNSIPNQFLIYTEKGIYFQSYDSIIAFLPNDPNKKTILDVNTWDYSNTTGKYRNIVLMEDKKETKRKIDNGTYLLKDLNKQGDNL